MAKKRLPLAKCIVCFSVFQPTRAWHVFCGESCRKQAKATERQTEYSCHYCGLLSVGVDHVPPRSVRQFILDSGLAVRYPFVEVRCCQECNSALGDRPLWTLTQRKEFVRQWLKRRYKKYLNIPEWTDSQLAHVEGDMRDHVLHGLAVQELIRKRLQH